MLRWLFLDMNSYFASVEQQLCPELRGKPVAVAPVDTDHTSCIAASYEAKAFGIHTGTRISDARHMCPGLQVVVARPPLYVDFHNRIKAVVENHLHVDRVESIDEMACRLPSNLNSEETARGIALAIKESLYRTVGPWIRCSVGIAPNRFLSKVASDMQKPDGLVVLDEKDLRERLMTLQVRDLPGVGWNMQLRLAASGADTMEALWGFSVDSMARAFGGVTGRHFWHNLHGENVLEMPTQRRTIGHSNVLSPELRTEAGAHAMLVRLVHKAAARMRDMQYAAGHMSLHILYEDKSDWGLHVGIDYAQDTQTLLEVMDFLWGRRKRGREGKAGTPKKVGMVLFDLELAKNVTLPLFPREERRMDLARAMDRINARYGRQRIYFGDMHGTRQSAGMRIAFNSVPDENW